MLRTDTTRMIQDSVTGARSLKDLESGLLEEEKAGVQVVREFLAKTIFWEPFSQSVLNFGIYNALYFAQTRVNWPSTKSLIRTHTKKRLCLLIRTQESPQSLITSFLKSHCTCEYSGPLLSSSRFGELVGGRSINADTTDKATVTHISPVANQVKT
jgi:hypothetical protein